MTRIVFECDRRRRPPPPRRRDRLRRRCRRRGFVFEIDHRRRPRRARWSCLGLPSRWLVAVRLEGPIWEVRKPPRSALGLPGPKIVKINKNFIKNTTQDLPPARIPESGLPDWWPEKGTRFR